MDAMRYLGDLAKRNPNMRLGKALEKLAIQAKAEELRREIPASGNPHKPATSAGWLVEWETNRDDIQAAIDNLPAGTKFTGTPVYVGHTYDTRRLFQGQCNPCRWGAVPERYIDGRPSSNSVCECIHCGYRPSGVTADPNGPAAHAIFDLTPADVADEHARRTDVYGF